MKGLILQSVVQTQFLLTSMRAGSVAHFSGLVYKGVVFKTKAKVLMEVRQKYLFTQNRGGFLPPVCHKQLIQQNCK